MKPFRYYWPRLRDFAADAAGILCFLGAGYLFLFLAWAAQP